MSRIISPHGVTSVWERRAIGVDLIGAKDGADYSKRIDRLRMGTMSRMARLWRVFLKKENRKLANEVEAFEDTGIEGYRTAIEAAVTRFYEPTTPYEQTYVTVFPLFAERVYDALTGGSKTAGSGLMLKADPELIALWEAVALEFIRTEGADLITDVRGFSHTIVVSRVRRLTEQAVSDGWSINRFKKEIMSELDTIADYRARRIARTETMRSSNLGSREAALSTSLDLIKEWLIAPLGTGDRHATLEYAGLHDQRREMDALYDVGGHGAMYPVDLRLPAKESINCRCSERYIPR